MENDSDVHPYVSNGPQTNHYPVTNDTKATDIYCIAKRDICRL